MSWKLESQKFRIEEVARLNVIAEVDERTVLVHFGYGSSDDAAADARPNGLDRIVNQMIDAQRNASTIEVDGKNYRFDEFTLSVAAHRFLPGYLLSDGRQASRAMAQSRGKILEQWYLAVQSVP